MTTREVHKAVRNLFGNYEYPLFNSFIFAWESDFFAISKSGYSVEVEVKVSRADFKKDFTHKTDKHKIFSRHKELAVCLASQKSGTSYKTVWNRELKIWEKTDEATYVQFVKPCEQLPNKFYYASPEGLINPEEVPAYAGLIYTQKEDIMKPTYWIEKPAPFLHKHKKCFDKVLLGKYYHRNNELASLLSYYLRRNDLTDQQEKDLMEIYNRFR